MVNNVTFHGEDILEDVLVKTKHMEEVGQDENEVHSQQEVDKNDNDLDSGREQVISS